MNNFNNPYNKPKKQGTGFTNLGRYLQANKGPSVGGAVQQQTQKAQQGIQQGFQTFQQEREKSAADTAENRQYTQNVLSKPFDLSQQDIDKFAAFRQGQYTGPTGLQNQQQIQQGIQQAQQTAQLAATQEGRKQLLQSEVRSPAYTTGKRRLDELFLAQEDPALKQARIQSRGLGNALSAKEQEAQDLARQTAEQNRLFGQELTGQIAKTREDIVNPVVQRLQTAQNLEAVKSDINRVVREMVGDYDQNTRYNPELFAKRVSENLKYLDIPKEELMKLMPASGQGDEWTMASNMLSFLNNFGLVNEQNLNELKGVLTKAAENRLHSYRVPLLIQESLSGNYDPNESWKTRGLNFEGVATQAELERLNTLAKLGGIDEQFDPTKERYKAGKFGLDTKRGQAFVDAMISGRSAEDVFKERNWEYNPDESGANFLSSNAFQKLVEKLPTNTQFTQAGSPTPTSSTPSLPNVSMPSLGNVLSLPGAQDIAGSLGLPTLGSNVGGIPGISGGTGIEGGIQGPIPNINEGLGLPGVPSLPNINDIIGQNTGGLPGISGGTGIGMPSSTSNIPVSPSISQSYQFLGGEGNLGGAGDIPVTSLPIILQNLKEGKLSPTTLDALVKSSGVEGGSAYLAAANKLFGPQNRNQNFLDDPQFAAQLAASGVPLPIAAAFAAPTAMKLGGQALNKVEGVTESTGLNKIPLVSELVNQLQSTNLANQQQLGAIGNILDPRVSFSQKGVALKDILQTSINQPIDSIKGMGEGLRNIVSQISGIGSAGRSVANVAENAFKAAAGAVGGIFCFAEGTPIVMSDGSIKRVEEIDLNDECLLGGKVFAKGVALEDDIYYYNDVLVTGQHAVFEDGKWIRVENSNKAYKTELTNQKVYPVANEQHILVTANGIVFTDHQETDEGSTATDDQRLEILNSQKERNIYLDKFLVELSLLIKVA